MTAGRLADLSGLTTGAITHILDRLEKRGSSNVYATPQDRRKVFIRVQKESLKPLLPKYEALGKAYMSIVEHYSDSELKLIFDYMEKMSQISEHLMADTIAARREE